MNYNCILTNQRKLEQTNKVFKIVTFESFKIKVYITSENTFIVTLIELRASFSPTYVIYIFYFNLSNACLVSGNLTNLGVFTN